MSKKVEFLNPSTREAFWSVRTALARVPWKSREYGELMDYWRMLCRVQILKISHSPELDTDPAAWRELYERCPSGSLEERVALGEWQNLLIFASPECGCTAHAFTLRVFRRSGHSRSTNPRDPHRSRFSFCFWSRVHFLHPPQQKSITTIREEKYLLTRPSGVIPA